MGVLTSAAEYIHLIKNFQRESCYACNSAAEVIIPLSQHTGAPCKPVVSIGQEVKDWS